MQDANPTAQLVMAKLLRAVVGGVTIYTMYPRNAPTEMVVVQRVGGSLQNTITDAPMFTVQCYAPTQFAAEQLASMVWHALYRQQWAGMRVDGHMVRGWETAAAPQMFLDPDRPDTVRFQFSGQLLISTLRQQ